MKFDARWIEPSDRRLLDEAREFARRKLYERAALHADLEEPGLFARSRFLEVRWRDRLVGVASVLEGVLGARALALGAELPGAAAALARNVERPYVAMATDRYLSELERAGGRHLYSDLQMVRLHREPLPPPDPRVEPLTNLEEVRRVSSSTIAPEHFKSGPFFGIRAPDGELVSVGGVHYVTERLACLASIETLEKQRRRGFAAAIVIELIRALEKPSRQVVLQVRNDKHGAIALYGRLGFRGTRRMSFLRFGD
jgi:hypothetical protein